MKKIGTWLFTTGPLLLLSGLQSAQAAGGGGDKILCYFLPWLCGGGDPPHNPGGGGGPTAVPEHEMAALFSVALVTAGISAYRRWKKNRH
jgi:hypothetical protein